jgi:hypothetical protein
MPDPAIVAKTGAMWASPLASLQPKRLGEPEEPPGGPGPECLPCALPDRGAHSRGDDLEIAKRLRDAGFNDVKAETITAALRDAHDADLSRLATKDDLRAEIAALRSEMSADNASLRSEIRTIRSEMEILRRDLTISLGGMIVVLGGFLAAIQFIS